MSHDLLNCTSHLCVEVCARGKECGKHSATDNERESQREKETPGITDMVFMYAGLCDGDDAQIVFCLSVRRVVSASHWLVMSNIPQQSKVG